MNFSRTISVWAEQRPQQPAIHFEGSSITYGELERRIQVATEQLSAHGVQATDRVAYLGLNHPVMLVMLFALCRLGAIFEPLNFRLSAAEHARQLLDSTPTLLFHETAVQRAPAGGRRPGRPAAAALGRGAVGDKRIRAASGIPAGANRARSRTMRCWSTPRAPAEIPKGSC